MKRSSFAVLLLTLLFTAGLLSMQCRSTEKISERRPAGILLITIDTLRADHLGFHDYQRKTTPFLDQLAAESTVFLDVSAQIPKTLPSVVSLMTSCYPMGTGVISNGNVLAQDAVTLAELLRDQGFHTIAFSSNGNLIEERGITQGFDEFTFHPWLAFGLTDTVLRRFESPLPDDFFVWVHYNDPHGKYAPPDRFNEMFLDDPLYDPARKVRLEYEPLAGFNMNFVLGAVPLYQQRPYLHHPRRQETDFYIAQYDAEIRGTDAQLRRLINGLGSAGKLDDVLVVITADHGEGLGEHDFYFEHGWFAYQGQLRVPLVIRFPDQREPRVVETPVGLIDLAPTVLDILGLPRPETFQGRSLLPLINRTSSERGPVYAMTPDVYPHQYRSIRSGRWKYIVDEDGGEELYNLAADPGESINLAGIAHFQRDMLRDLLNSGVWNEGRGDRQTLAPGALDEDVADNLRALGYLDQ